MPFNGSNGTFNRLYNFQADAAAGIKILAARMDGEMNGIAAGLSNCLTRDGQSPPTADLPMGGRKIVNLGAPTVASDAATKAYADAFMPLAGGTFTGRVNYGDGNFFNELSAGYAYSVYDNGDYFYYARTQNLFSWAIGGVTELTLDAANVVLPSNNLVMQGGQITFLNADTAEKRVQFLQSGGRSSYLYANGSGFGAYDSVNGSIWDFSYSTGLMRIQGANPWTANNFNPASYAALSGATFTGNVQAPQFRARGSGGYVDLVQNSVNTGYLAFFSSGDVRQGYIGFASTNGPINYASDTGGGHSFTGGPVTLGSNSLSAGGVSVNGNAVWHAGNFSPSGYLGAGANTWLNSTDGQRRLYFAGGGTTYFGSGSEWRWQNNSSTDLATLNASGVFNAVGGVQVNGNAVWHAGNFNPASYQAALGFTPVRQGGVSGQAGNTIYIGFNGVSRIKAQVDASDFGNIVFDGDLSSGSLAGNFATLKGGGNDVWTTGNFNPASYAALTGASFSGAISAPSASFSASVSAPTVTLASGISVSASGGKAIITVGGSAVMSVDSSGNIRALANITGNAGSL